MATVHISCASRGMWSWYYGHVLQPGQPVGISGISLVLSEHFPFFAQNSSGSQSSIKLHRFNV